jgi:GNAT superfamily N-acetyltransferase
VTVDVSTDPARLDVDRIHRWLSEDAYWARGRSRPAVAKAVEQSVNFGAYLGHEQVGYARLVTDRSTHAWLCDVYVDRRHRGRGIGTALLAAADAELTAYGVGRAMLATQDAHALYERFGFAPLADSDQFMARSYDTA